MTDQTKAKTVYTAHPDHPISFLDLRKQLLAERYAEEAEQAKQKANSEAGLREWRNGLRKERKHLVERLPQLDAELADVEARLAEKAAERKAARA